jgi:hypothetical protein
MSGIKVSFTDFWNGFKPETFYLYKMLLMTDYNIIIDNTNPDIIIGSIFGDSINHLQSKVKILYASPYNHFF